MQEVLNLGDAVPKALNLIISRRLHTVHKKLYNNQH